MRSLSSKASPITLALSTLALVSCSVLRPLPGRLVSEAILTSAAGGNGAQIGTGLYSCDDVAAKNLGGNFTSQYQCTQLLLPPPGLKCTDCTTDFDIGRYQSTQGNVIVFMNNANCGAPLDVADCKVGGNGKGTCMNWNHTGQNCTGMFALWDDQPQ